MFWRLPEDSKHSLSDCISVSRYLIIAVAIIHVYLEIFKWAEDFKGPQTSVGLAERIPLEKVEQEALAY